MVIKKPHEPFCQGSAWLVCFGFFISCSVALFSERCMAQQMASVLFLVFNKDLSWLHQEGAWVVPSVDRRYILIEITFVSLVFLAYSALIIRGYAVNLKFFFDHQQVLRRVASGELDVEVPVTRNDEFGIIALHTNQMIEGLASLAEAWDNETGMHIMRIQHYVRVLVGWLREKGYYSDILDQETINLIYKSAPDDRQSGPASRGATTWDQLFFTPSTRDFTKPS